MHSKILSIKRQPFHQTRQNIIGEVIHEFRHRVDTLPASGTAWNDNAVAALGDARRVLTERIE